MLILKILNMNKNSIFVKMNYSNFKAGVLFIIILVSSSIIQAQKKGAEFIKVVATAKGSTLEIAKKYALREALTQVYYEFISSDTRIVNDSIYSEEILSKTFGEIKKYEVLNDGYYADSKLYFVTLNVEVPLPKNSDLVESEGSVK